MCGYQGVSDDEVSLKDLGTSATAVTKALDDLMLHIKRGANRGRQVRKLVQYSRNCQSK